MDLYCPKCGEPWDFDCLHEEVEARNANGSPANYDMVSADFRSRGCQALHSAFDGKCNESEVEGTDRTFGLTRAAAASALYDVLGDDMDGAAAMLDDMGF